MGRRFPTFVVVVLGMLSVWYAYLGAELVAPFALSGPIRVAAWALLALPFLAIAWLPLGYWGRPRRRGSARREWLVTVAYFSMGLLSMIFSLVVVRDLAYAMAIALRALGVHSLDPLFASRYFYGGGANLALLAGTAACFAIGVSESRRVPRVKKISVPIANLPPEWEGLRIAQISDLHVGHSVRRPFVARVVAQVNALEPDIVAITGDLVDGKPAELKDDIAPLAELAPRLGTYYVTGNHEYYWGGAEWVEAVRALGIVPLENEGRALDRGGARLWIAGVPDLMAPRFLGPAPSPAAALREAPGRSVRVLLAHQPKVALAAAEAGYDLQLSGHTHGGQFFPWTLVVRYFHPFWRGLNRCGKMWVYVSRGTGTWGPPLRLGAASEITLLQLTTGTKGAGESEEIRRQRSA